MYLLYGSLSAVNMLPQIATHKAPTLHIELVGDPEVTLQSRVAHNTGERVALDVTCGLPEVAHLCAGSAVDFVK